MELRLLDIPRMAYDQCLALMRGLVEARRHVEGPEILILVEHDPVLTMGRRAVEEDILASTEDLSRAGIAVHRIERGGLITYHGPGQLVVYPVLRLRNLNLGVATAVRFLEQATIDTLGEFGIVADRRPDHPGVWIGPDKIASIGLAVRRNVTFHGLALNCQPDLSAFNMINPCGLTDVRVTSMAEVIGRPVSLSEVRSILSAHLARQLSLDLQPWTLDQAWEFVKRHGADKQETSAALAQGAGGGE